MNFGREYPRISHLIKSVVDAISIFFIESNSGLAFILEPISSTSTRRKASWVMRTMLPSKLEHVH